MSRVTKIKHLKKEFEADEYDLPKENQQIVRIVSSKGNNLHEVETDDPAADKFLVSMPTKFRKNVWIKRGDFVIVEAIEEGDKVKAEIVRILTQEHIKVFSKEGVWPKTFTKKRELDENDDSETDLPRNTNRRPPMAEESDDDSDEN